jgi:hypothetical protein
MYGVHCTPPWLFLMGWMSPPESVVHPKSETRRRRENRGHSAVIMEMTDEQEKQI